MKVIIVKEGQWGSVPPRDYSRVIGMCERLLKGAGAEVCIVETAQDAREILRLGKVVSVIFISRGAYPEAGILAKDFPDLKVIILSGLDPLPGELHENITWLHKGQFSEYDLVEAVLN